MIDSPCKICPRWSKEFPKCLTNKCTTISAVQLELRMRKTQGISTDSEFDELTEFEITTR
ncbi:MAG: hypothetical protein GY861_27045 [bacterium]|nr:hypothetical protein [bacterium]